MVESENKRRFFFILLTCAPTFPSHLKQHFFNLKFVGYKGLSPEQIGSCLFKKKHEKDICLSATHLNRRQGGLGLAGVDFIHLLLQNDSLLC